jgi:hypothetical protein
VLDEASGTFWASDLLFTQHTPVIDGSIQGFIAAIDDLKHLPVVRFVPGHGRTHASWTQALETEQRYLLRILSETRAALKQRKTLEEALETVGVDEAANWVNFEQFHRRNVTAAYTELEWE